MDRWLPTASGVEGNAAETEHQREQTSADVLGHGKFPLMGETWSLLPGCGRGTVATRIRSGVGLPGPSGPTINRFAVTTLAVIGQHDIAHHETVDAVTGQHGR